MTAPDDRADPGSGGDQATRVAVADDQLDALVELLDLLGQGQRESCLDGDVLGQVGERQVLAPQLEAGSRGAQHGLGQVVAEGAPGVPVEEPGEPCPTEPADGVRVGVADGQEPQRRLGAQVRSERRMPVRAKNL